MVFFGVDGDIAGFVLLSPRQTTTAGRGMAILVSSSCDSPMPQGLPNLSLIALAALAQIVIGCPGPLGKPTCEPQGPGASFPGSGA